MLSIVERKYNQELALKRVMDVIESGIHFAEDIIPAANISKTMIYYYIKVLKKSGHIKTTKTFDANRKKHFLSIHSTGLKFTPKTIEEIQGNENDKKETEVQKLSKVGPYDELIKNNPKLKLYRPFENGYKNVRVDTKVNRAVGTSFALYDMY